MTGSMPGIAASTSETWEFGSPPNSVEAPEKSFDCEVTWAWISMPTTTSQSPVAPLMSFDFFDGAFIPVSSRWQRNGAPEPIDTFHAIQIAPQFPQETLSDAVRW